MTHPTLSLAALQRRVDLSQKRQDRQALLDKLNHTDIPFDPNAIYLSPIEIAKKLNITRQAITTSIKKGKLRARKLRNSWFIHPTDFEQFLDTYYPDKKIKRAP